MTWAILNADARHVPLRDESVQCIVTSPPYWGLRDYSLKASAWGGDPDCSHQWGEASKIRRSGGTAKSTLGSSFYSNGVSQENIETKVKVRSLDSHTGSFCHLCDAWLGCLGLEPSPDLYLEHIVQVFREAHRVLRKDGTLWVNMGDSYTDSGRGKDTKSTLQGSRNSQTESRKVRVRESVASGLRPKNLIGMPWRLAFALQADGWTLRRDIIWAKTNPMPESAGDRPTTAHEYIFLFAKSRKYYYDGKAIAEPVTCERMRGSGPMTNPLNGDRNDTVSYGDYRKRRVRSPAGWKTGQGSHGSIHENGREHEVSYVEDIVDTRNSRSVWSMATQAYSGAHFATFPEELAARCIKAGSKKGDIVLDIFSGAGTTVLTADKLERVGIGTELGPEYCAQARARVFNDAPLLNYQGVA